MGNVLIRWDADPKNAKASELAPYVTHQVLEQILAQYQYMATHGLAYRGTPDSDHIRVIAADSSSAALRNCLVPSKSDPYTQYVVATGKPVPQSGPGGLHPKAVTVVFSDGRWRVSSIIPDLGRTCTP
jgi:hypothetical protein